MGRPGILKDSSVAYRLCVPAKDMQFVGVTSTSATEKVAYIPDISRGQELKSIDEYYKYDN